MTIGNQATSLYDGVLFLGLLYIKEASEDITEREFTVLPKQNPINPLTLLPSHLYSTQEQAPDPAGYVVLRRDGSVPRHWSKLDA